ncbi:MAG: cytochrome c3 family protein, partial [Dehalococcoidia bacterium]|nr:cytochrome c3 family protein [Dehalococcoidia bacterium]
LTLAGCAQQATSEALLPALPTATAAPSSTSAPAAPNVSSDSCLSCHGPYEKVVQASANYTIQDGSGSIVNPHTMIDISSSKRHNTGKGVPECSNCHKPHPLSLASSKDVPKANVEFCYSCHHQRNFIPCSQCHAEGGG